MEKIRFFVLNILTLFLSLDFNAFVSFGKEIAQSKPNNMNFITAIQLGDKNAKKQIDVYISPSCLHCGKFIATDVADFLEKHNNACGITIKFLVTSTKDIFIMKIIQNLTNNAEDEYFKVYKDYIKRVIATINHVNPTQKQKSLYKGLKKDPDMIKFQVIASEFGFSDTQIQQAFPNMDEPYEQELIKVYKERASNVSKIIKTKELDLPLMIMNGKILKKLKEATK